MENGAEFGRGPAAESGAGAGGGAPEDLIPGGRAAAILGCSPATVGSYRRAGLLRAWLRAGSQWVYSERDVRALLEPYRPAGEAPPPTRAELERRERDALAELRAAGVRV